MGLCSIILQPIPVSYSFLEASSTSPLHDSNRMYPFLTELIFHLSIGLFGVHVIWTPPTRLWTIVIKMTSSDNSPSGIRVSLHNADLWNKFYPKNEMVVTKGHKRKLFPDLNVNIEGLIPDALYTVSFYLERIGDFMYYFSTRTGQWEEAGESKEDLPVDKKQHKYGSMAGEHWMKYPVSFSDFRITHDSDDMKKLHSDNLILVSSMHKYQPVITVKKLSDGKEEEFRLTMTEFMVVTSFRNREIAELKKVSNKYPSGKSRGRKRAIPSDPSPAAPPTGPAPVGSPVSSPAKKTTAPVHHQGQIKTSSASSPSKIPPAMAPSSVTSSNLPVQTKTPPASSPSPVPPNNSQKQIKVEPALSPTMTPPVMVAPSAAPIQQQIQMKTSPVSSPLPAAPNSSKKQIKAEPASPTATPPPAMVAPSPAPVGHQNLLKNSPAASPSPPAMVPPYVAPNHFQNQIMPPPTTVPPYMGLDNLQNPMVNPTVMTMPPPYMAPPIMATPPAMNPYWNQYGMWNMPQNPMAPMPQPPQWNMIQGAAQFGHPGIPQFNGAGPSYQQGTNDANFFFRY
ncbi:unnamed protein product [Caenorhabditis brenneri]